MPCFLPQGSNVASHNQAAHATATPASHGTQTETTIKTNTGLLAVGQNRHNRQKQAYGRGNISRCSVPANSCGPSCAVEHYVLVRLDVVSIEIAVDLIGYG
jgi:hypothetical protein